MVSKSVPVLEDARHALRHNSENNVFTQTVHMYMYIT